MSEIELTASDKVSPTWGRLSRYFEARIEHLRRQNDGDKTELETAKLRGRIAELKGILALAEPVLNAPNSRPE